MRRRVRRRARRGRRVPRPRQADRAARRPDELRGRGVGRAVPARPRAARASTTSCDAAGVGPATWSGSARPSSSGRPSPGRTDDGRAAPLIAPPRDRRSGSSAARSTRSTSAISRSPEAARDPLGLERILFVPGRPCRRTSRAAPISPASRPAGDGRAGDRRRARPRGRAGSSSTGRAVVHGRHGRGAARRGARGRPRADVTVILSAESFAELPTWHEPGAPRSSLARVAVAPRPGHPAPDPRRLAAAAPAAARSAHRSSSTGRASTSPRSTIRRRVAAGDSIERPRPAGAWRRLHRSASAVSSATNPRRIASRDRTRPSRPTATTEPAAPTAATAGRPAASRPEAAGARPSGRRSTSPAGSSSWPRTRRRPTSSCSTSPA